MKYARTVLGACAVAAAIGLQPSQNVAADSSCDTCSDQSAPVESFCWLFDFSLTRHRRTGSNAEEGHFMPLHSGGGWYCNGCGADSECPGPGSPPIEGEHVEEGGELAAAIREKDSVALLAAANDLDRYLLIDRKSEMLMLINCTGESIAQYKLTVEQVALLTD